MLLFEVVGIFKTNHRVAIIQFLQIRLVKFIEFLFVLQIVHMAIEETTEQMLIGDNRFSNILQLYFVELNYSRNIKFIKTDQKKKDYPY